MTRGESDYPQFNDGKAPDALRTIGEVAKATGIRQHVLRYWEDQFPQLSPVKRSGGRRYYRPEDIALIASIDRLVHREGYTLRGARKAISSKREAPAERTEQVSRAAPASEPAQLSMFDGDQAATVRSLSTIRAELAAALDAA